MSDTLLDELARILVVPAKSGLYITKGELIALAHVSEASLRVNDRARMLADILKSSQTPEELIRLLGRLIALAREHVEVYEELCARAPTAAPCFEPWRSRTAKTIDRLEQLQQELELTGRGSG